ncbi:MAG: mechanosensitive ion channel family protein [Eggerthellaceae bacterium]|nr:mechanosensitive ion channel family protein [Eggerthellaceae bacterium]
MTASQESSALANSTAGEAVESVEQSLEETYTLMERLVQSDLTLSLVTAVIVLFVTWLLVRLATTFAKRIMSHEASALPANSIFLNIIRVVIWALGIGFMLSFCFDKDVTGLFAALGVGGIALSLGLQDTISNVIGGINVSVSGLVKPGDHIKVGTTGLQGTVQDVNLRQTVIEDRVKNRIIIPNSAMNTSIVVKIPPRTHVVIPVVIRAEDDRLTAVAHSMEHAVEHAVSRVSKLKKAPSMMFTEITDYGYRGTMVFGIAEEEKVNAATDAAVRAMALYAHGNIAKALAEEAGVEAKAVDEAKAVEDAKELVSQ